MSDTEILQIITLATPVAILLVVLAMVRVFMWQDDRELRRREDERRLKAQQ
jgi:hypothetical protein